MTTEQIKREIAKLEARREELSEELWAESRERERLEMLNLALEGRSA